MITEYKGHELETDKATGRTVILGQGGVGYTTLQEAIAYVDDSIKRDAENAAIIKRSLIACAAKIVAAHETCVQQERLAEDAGKKAIEAALACGRNLLIAKETGRGLNGFKFCKWIAENCKFSERTAQRYMTMAKNPTHVSETELKECKSLRQAQIATGAVKGKKKEMDRYARANAFVSDFLPHLPTCYQQESERMYRILYPLHAWCEDFEDCESKKRKKAEEDKTFDAGLAA